VTLAVWSRRTCSNSIDASVKARRNNAERARSSCSAAMVSASCATSRSLVDTRSSIGTPSAARTGPTRCPGQGRRRRGRSLDLPTSAAGTASGLRTTDARPARRCRLRWKCPRSQCRRHRLRAAGRFVAHVRHCRSRHPGNQVRRDRPTRQAGAAMRRTRCPHRLPAAGFTAHCTDTAKSTKASTVYDDRHPVDRHPAKIQTGWHASTLVSTAQHRALPRQHIDNRAPIGAPRSQHAENRGRSWERIKAVVSIPAGHGLDLEARPKGFEPLTF
jgi:hypothetical protein